MSGIDVFSARKIITMDPNRAEATHVAVRDGKVLAVGGADCADQWGDVTHRDELANAVLMPGFVEGHAHMMAGAMWQYAYAGYHDRIDPDGKLWKGMTTIEEVIEGLSAHEKTLEPGEPLVGWGFDPIFLTTERLSAKHLDAISTERPIAIIYSNFHLMCVNSNALELAHYTRETNVEGVIKRDDGHPHGELQEMAAMFPIMRRLGIDFRGLSQTEAAIRSYGEVAKRAGVTTITDLFSSLDDDDLAEMLSVTGTDDFPVRIVPALNALSVSPSEIVARAQELRGKSTDMLRLGAVKLMTDGAIQGYTARVKWPFYVTGHPNGIWNTAPEQIFALVDALHDAGVQMHIHVNGDEASEVTLDALETAMAKHTRPGMRHVLQHCQLMGADQYRRCADLGVCTNIFANHLWYFGDQHYALTIGPDRAERMNASRAALDAGVHIALHSDAPVTALGPIKTASYAVNRTTMTGRVLGEAQRITVDEALYAITLGAAYTLRLDDEVGSIEVGKRADFAVLGADPYAVAPQDLGDVPVQGTVSGGRLFLV